MGLFKVPLIFNIVWLGFGISYVTPALHGFDIWHCCGGSRYGAGAAGSEQRPLPLSGGSAAPLIYWPTSERRGTRATTGTNPAESRDKLSSPRGGVGSVWWRWGKSQKVFRKPGKDGGQVKRTLSATEKYFVIVTGNGRHGYGHVVSWGSF